MRDIKKHKLSFSCDQAIWLVSKQAPLKPISNSEKLIAQKLPLLRSQEYCHSRGYVREVLSCLFGMSPLDIPLSANPGKAPNLLKGWGHVSFSHCIDALLIGWSKEKIGVDIEKTDRFFDAKRLAKRFYYDEERIFLESLNGDLFRSTTLKLWVLKEAAIKCQKGTISNDLSKWIINYDFSKALNKSHSIELKTYHCEYKSWSIGIAKASHKYYFNPLICIT